LDVFPPMRKVRAINYSILKSYSVGKHCL